MNITFQRARKSQAKARVANIGPSGSGKTLLALFTAQKLGAKIAVIDTENGSASKYADRFEFDVLNLSAREVDHHVIDWQGGSYDTQVELLVGAQTSFVALPISAEGWELGGALSYAWTVGDESVLQQDMVFHIIPGIWMDDWGIEISECVRIGEAGAVPLANVPRRLIVKD